MLKTNKRCKACLAVKKSPALLNRIYNSSFYTAGGESLAQIAREHDFSYDSLKTHVKKHQFLSSDDFHKRHLAKISKDAEKQILKRAIESKQVWDSVINQGMEKLENGQLVMRTADLLKAAKDKSDFELKVKDQEMAMMEMVYHFASGESTESQKYDRRIIEGKTVTDYDPADGTTEDSGTGPDGPSGVYYPATWDAATPGTD